MLRDALSRHVLAHCTFRVVLLAAHVFSTIKPKSQPAGARVNFKNWACLGKNIYSTREGHTPECQNMQGYPACFVNIGRGPSFCLFKTCHEQRWINTQNSIPQSRAHDDLDEAEEEDDEDALEEEADDCDADDVRDDDAVEEEEPEDLALEPDDLEADDASVCSSSSIEPSALRPARPSRPS
jgi:hypothetical protein